MDHALDQSHLQDLLEERVLAHDAMDAEKVRRIRDDMERAQAKRLQPHHIASFFLEAFRRLNGTAFEREPKRFELTFVPAVLRQRDRQIGTGAAVLPRYERISPSAPRILGGALILPMGLLPKSPEAPAPGQFSLDPAARARIEQAAMQAVMAAERGLGFEPKDVSAEKCGYDIESRDPQSGHLRFLEVKGRANGADTVTVTRNEIITALHAPDRFILALVMVDGEVAATPRYLRRPFTKEPDFAEISSNYDLGELLTRSVEPC